MPVNDTRFLPWKGMRLRLSGKGGNPSGREPSQVGRGDFQGQIRATEAAVEGRAEQGVGYHAPGDAPLIRVPETQLQAMGIGRRTSETGTRPPCLYLIIHCFIHMLCVPSPFLDDHFQIMFKTLERREGS